MFTSVTGAAARRVAASRPITLTIRRFTVSRWTRQATKAAIATATKKERLNPQMVIPVEKTTASGKPVKKPTAKKPAAKKKPAVKKKPVAKKKKVVKPKKAKKPIRKMGVLSPEKLERVKIAGLRKTALLSQQPKLKAVNSWACFMVENTKNVEQGDIKSTDRVVQLKHEWTAMSDSQKEPYVARATANRAENAQTLLNFAHSYPVEDIILANRARMRLNLLKFRKSKASKIPDDRIPTRPLTAYARFLTSRHAETLKLPLNERFAAIAQEWKELSDAERRAFTEAYNKEKEVFDRENKPMTDTIKEKERVRRIEARKAITAARRASPSPTAETKSE